MKFEDIGWEAIAAAVAVVFSFGSVFYFIVSMAKDVERVSIESVQQEQKISKNNKDIEKNKDYISKVDKNISVRVTEIDSKITAIQQNIGSSSTDIRSLLETILKKMEHRENE